MEGAATSYAYDAASRLASLGHDFAGTAQDVTFAFAHNPASQIVTRTASNDLYAYTPAVQSVASVLDGRNRLTSHAGAAVGYDLKGNLTSEGGRTLSYDSENRLVGVAAVGQSSRSLLTLRNDLFRPGAPGVRRVLLTKTVDISPSLR